MDKIKEKVINIFKVCGVKNPKIKFTNNYTIIGCCYSNGYISFSLPSLIYNNEEGVESLVKHEIAHLTYFNHGKDFYKLVKKLGGTNNYITISKYVIVCPRCISFARINKIPKGILTCKKCKAKGIEQRIMVYKHTMEELNER